MSELATAMAVIHKRGWRLRALGQDNPELWDGKRHPNPIWYCYLYPGQFGSYFPSDLNGTRVYQIHSVVGTGKTAIEAMQEATLKIDNSGVAGLYEALLRAFEDNEDAVTARNN